MGSGKAGDIFFGLVTMWGGSHIYFLLRVQMGYNQFMWGMSNGVMISAMAGSFWFGLAAFHDEFRFWPAVLIALGALAVVVGSLSLRRRAGGFRLSDLKLGTEAQKLETRRIRVGFRWTLLLEWLLVGSAFGICNGNGRPDLAWPAVGVVVSIHFVPLGYVFRMPVYYFTAAVGCVVSVIALTQAPPTSLWVVGAGMGSVLWATSAFTIFKFKLLADHALRTRSRLQ